MFPRIFKKLNYLTNLNSKSGFCSQKIFNNLLSTNPFLELKHHYGQAGVLKTDFKKVKFDIFLITTWEDEALYKFYYMSNSGKNALDQSYENALRESLQKYQILGEKKEIFFMNDEGLLWPNTKLEALNDGSFFLVAEIPEYFGLDLVNLGSIDTIKGSISSKIVGNLKLDVNGENSNINISRAKTEFCDISLRNGKLDIGQYLEAYNANLNASKGSIHLKKAAISNTLRINHGGHGNIIIGSCYVGQQFHVSTSTLKKETNSNYKLQVDTTLEEKINQLENNLKSSEHLHINSSNGDCSIQHFQGSAIINLSKGNLKISNHNPVSFCTMGIG